MLLSLTIGFFTLTSCDREVIDITTTEEETITPEEEEVTPANCDGLLVLSSDVVNVNESGSAILLKTSCSLNADDYDHNYMIYSNSYDFWGEELESVNATFNSDGMPGLGFGSNGIPQVGDVLTQYNAGIYPGLVFESMDDPSALWALSDDTQVTITEVGDEVGASIGGTISGTLNDLSGQTIELTGSFCLPIVYVCE